MEITISRRNHIDFFQKIKQPFNSTLFSTNSSYTNSGDRMTNRMILRYIDDGDYHLKFKVPYIVNTYCDDGYYYCDIPELEIFAVGANKEELLLDISDSLIDSWQEIVECDINELNNKAIEYRELLLEKIDRI